MRNKFWLAISFLLILAVFLAACSQAPAPEPTMTNIPEPTIESSPTVPPTTVPQEIEQPAGAGSAYPAPTIQYVPYNPYPDPIEGEQVDWSQVEALLQNEKIAEVLQQFTLQVVITLEDGRIILVDEPAKDDIFKLLDACGDKCNTIRRKSEF